MLEYAVKKIIKSGIDIAKDILSKRINEENEKLLQKKREKAHKFDKLDKDQLINLTLDEKEKIQGNIIISKDETYTSLSEHINDIKSWSREIGFKDLLGVKNISAIYIELDTYLTPLRSHIDPCELSQMKPLTRAVFDDESNCVILGQPGAGKTTSMKKLCSLFFDDKDTLHTKYNIPLLIRLREINPILGVQTVLLDKLSEIIAISFQFKNYKNTFTPDSIDSNTVYSAFTALLNELKPLIILDGFDEISDHETRENIVNELRSLSRILTTAKFVITCRSGEFNYNLSNTSTFEIASLNDVQISMFVEKWLGNKDEGRKFITEVKNSPYADTAIKPLALAHLCAIYERIGKIPDRPKTVYRKIVGLLIEEWDEQRSVKRVSSYAAFEADRKFEFMAHLAYYFTAIIKTTIFETQHFKEAYFHIYKNFGLKKNQAMLVALELESHTGLFIKSGYEKYEFAHKSLQEYLTAEYIVKLPTIPKSNKLLSKLANELAIATSISSNPSNYFTELVLNKLNVEQLPHSFYDAFVNRLIVEKPDFYENSNLVIAIFSLFSMWVCEGKITARTLDIRRIETSIIKEFLQFVCELDINSINDSISEYYSSPVEVIEVKGSVPLYKVRRNKFNKDYQLPTFILVIKA